MPFPRTDLERIVRLESKYEDINNDLKDIKTTLNYLVDIASQAKGRSEANSKILRGLSPALWTAMAGSILAGFTWLVVHVQNLPLK